MGKKRKTKQKQPVVTFRKTVKVDWSRGGIDKPKLIDTLAEKVGDRRLTSRPFGALAERKSLP